MENQIRLSRSILWIGVLTPIYLLYITLTHEEFLIFKLIGIGGFVVFFLIYQYDVLIISKEELTTEINFSKTQKLLISLNYKIHAILGGIPQKTLQEVVLMEDTATKEKDLADLKTLFNFSTIVQFKRFVNFLFHYNILTCTESQSINSNKGLVYSYFIDNYKTTKGINLKNIRGKATMSDCEFSTFNEKAKYEVINEGIGIEISLFIKSLKESNSVNTFFNAKVDEVTINKLIQAYLVSFEGMAKNNSIESKDSLQDYINQNFKHTL